MDKELTVNELGLADLPVLFPSVENAKKFTLKDQEEDEPKILRMVSAIEDLKKIQPLPLPKYLRQVWVTKSKATLSVICAYPLSKLPKNIRNEWFLENYDMEEVKRLPRGRRGLREYQVRGIMDGFVGGHEFHRIRQEIILQGEGSSKWTLEDLRGRQRIETLRPGDKLYIPPFILHTYQSLAEGSNLTVYCNTLFHPERPATQDTYKKEEVFDALKDNVLNS